MRKVRGGGCGKGDERSKEGGWEAGARIEGYLNGWVEERSWRGVGKVGGECDGAMLGGEDGGGEELVVGGRDELEGDVGRRLPRRDRHLVPEPCQRSHVDAERMQTHSP